MHVSSLFLFAHPSSNDQGILLLRVLFFVFAHPSCINQGLFLCTSFFIFIAHPSFYIVSIELFVGFCSFFFVFLLYLSQCASALLFFRFNHILSLICAFAQPFSLMYF